MKTSLLLAIALVVLVLGSLVWWMTRGTDPEVERADPRTSVHASENEADMGESNRIDSTRAAIAAPEPKTGLAAPEGATTIVAAISEAQSETKESDDVGNLDFERKYAWMTGDDRRAALESLRVLLNGGAGSGRNQPPLSEERSREIKREIEWLTEFDAR